MQEPNLILMALRRNNKGYWGATVRDDNGEVLCAAQGTSPYHRIDFIELDTLYQGLILAREYGYMEVEANVDS